jgi:hypothetical protein
MNTMLFIGLTGFVVMLVVNLVAAFGFGKPEAVPFSDQWWSIWFANYVVWLTFAIIGMGYKLSGKRR